MASSAITSQEIDGETVTNFIFLDFKITADVACSPEIKRHLLLVRNQDSILKSRDTFPTKVHRVKAVFSCGHVYTWRIHVYTCLTSICESWTTKKAVHWRIDPFELWCWGRLLRVPWTARRYNQSILKEISPECSLEGLTLMLKLQYFGLLMKIADSLERILMLGKIKGREGRRWQRTRWLDAITDDANEFEQAPGVGDGQESLMCCSSWGHMRVSTERLNNIKNFLFFLNSKSSL